MPQLWMMVLAWVGGIVLQQTSQYGIAILSVCLVITSVLAPRQQRMPWIVLAAAIGACRMGWYHWMPVSPPEQLVSAQVTIADVRSNWREQRLVVRDAVGYGYVVAVDPSEQYLHGGELIVSGQVDFYLPARSAYEASCVRRHVVGELRLYSAPVFTGATQWRAPLDHLRRATQRKLMQTFREPIASVVIGMLLGISGDVPPGVAAAFRASGTSHILVISGWNITIVAALCQIVVRACRLRGIWPLLIPLAVIGTYVVFTGASAAVVRAGFMGAIIVFGKWLDRPRDMWNVIAFAVFIMSALDPSTLWDMGFQLSTGATFGLIGFGNIIDDTLQNTPFGSPDLGWAREGLAATLAAQIPTFPIMLCRLGTPSPWSLLANMIITPVVPYAMASGTIVAITAWISPAASIVCSWLAIPAYAWIIDGSVALAQLPAPKSARIEHWLIEWGLHASWVMWFAYLRLSDTPPAKREMV